MGYYTQYVLSVLDYGGSEVTDGMIARKIIFSEQGEWEPP